MNDILIKAKESITDQYDATRIIRGKEYKLVHEFNETYLIIDETGKAVKLGKEYFYELVEE